jgi:hypothetical protein
MRFGRARQAGHRAWIRGPIWVTGAILGYGMV